MTAPSVHRRYAFDRVTVTSGARALFSLLGVTWSEYPGGPNLRVVADAARELAGAGAYGVCAWRSLGFDGRHAARGTCTAPEASGLRIEAEG